MNKKIIIAAVAVVLVIVLTLALLLGGSAKTNNGPTENPTGTTNERQLMWEQVFTEGKFKTSDSFRMIMGDMITIAAFSDEQGGEYIGIFGNIQDAGKIGTALYKQDSTTTYFYSLTSMEGQTEEQWALCENNSEEDDGSLDETMNGADDLVGNVEEVTTLLDTIEKVVYIQSVGTIDFLDVYYIPEDDNEESEEWTTTYDATIKIEYNGVVGEFRYTEHAFVEGVGTSSSTYWEKEIDGMNLFDWDFDAETMTLKNGDQTIKCTLVKDHLDLGEVDESQLAVIHMEIDSTTYEIKKMSVTNEDGNFTVEFINCKTIAELIELPNNIDETITMDEAAMQFGLTMFVILMGNAEIG